MADIIVIGGGPAGLAAAINARVRGKSVLVVSNPVDQSPLYKAPVIDNYPGLPGISGAELLHKMNTHADSCGVQIRTGRVLNIVPMNERFLVGIGSDFEECRAVILATGAQRGAKLPGEDALLGRGVSWCATCDGMLYRNKSVVVVGLSHDAAEEANFLQNIGCQVTYAARKTPAGLSPDIPVVLGQRISIAGEQSVTSVEVDDTLIPCQGAFVLRESMAPGDLLPGLKLDGGYICTKGNMQTNVPGVFACGDCTGLPLQIAKAVGEGQIAGLNCAAFLD